MSKRGGPIIPKNNYLCHFGAGEPELFNGSLNALDWELDMHGVQIYPADDRTSKWIQQSCKCPHCDHTWQAVAPLGSAGIECPKCHEVDLSFVWKER